MKAVSRQEQLKDELLQLPEIRAIAGGPAGTLDMQNTTTRIRVWTALYQSFQRQGIPALTSLVSYVRKYLKAFTAHTGYNVRDAGVSYLDRPMPTDLLGRLNQDCGVYALTVAYDVFKVAKTVGLALDFKLYFVVDHAMLAMIEPSGTHYIVSNDEITGPHAGVPAPNGSVNVEGAIASAYAGLKRWDNLFAVAATVPAIGTKLGDDAFRRSIWDLYQRGSSLEIQTVDLRALGYETCRNGDTACQTLSPDRRVHRNYFLDFSSYDTKATLIHQGISALRTSDRIDAPVARRDVLALARELMRVIRVHMNQEPYLPPNSTASASGQCIDRSNSANRTVTSNLPDCAVPYGGNQRDPSVSLTALSFAPPEGHPLNRAAKLLIYADKKRTATPEEQATLNTLTTGFFSTISPIQSGLTDFAKNPKRDAL